MTTPGTTTPWITYFKPNPQARLRLFCFHFAGGGASIYRTWAGELPPQVEVCPVQLPGRENRLREPAFTHITPLMPVIAQALRPYMNMPFAFFGHSMGVQVSFELARYLRRQGEVMPVYLGVSGHHALQLPPIDPPIHHLPEPEFIDGLRRLDGTPEEVLQHAELMQLILPTLRADFTLVETYTYTAEEPLACPISAFGAFEDHRTTRESMEAWREQTSGKFTLRMFPGDHFFILSNRALVIQALAQDLKPFLA